MKLYLVPAYLSALTLSTAAHAQRAPAQGPPAALTKDILALAVQCSEAGGKYGRSPGMLKILDLNGDGQRDYVVDINHYNCEGAASAMSSGSDGAGVSVYVGGPGNTARLAWSGTAHDTEVQGQGPAARLWLVLQGLECGQRDAARRSTAEQRGCLRPLRWSAAKSAFELAPLSEAKPLQ